MEENIKLSDTQKTALITMVKSLVIDCINVEINDFGIVDINYANSNTKQIHWFELCFTFLAEKIIQYNHQGMANFSYCTLIKSTHPIDHLFERFKQRNFKIQLT